MMLFPSMTMSFIWKVLQFQAKLQSLFDYTTFAADSQQRKPAIFSFPICYFLF